MNPNPKLPRSSQFLAAGVLAALIACLGPRASWAQTNGSSAKRPPADPGKRYLLVVETSRTTKKRADGVVQAVADLLSTGMRGQFRQDDSLGVWTFNHELHAGELPLQHWTAQGAGPLAGLVMKYLMAQSFEKSANLDLVFKNLRPIIKSSEALTIILITTGEQHIHGTPFDDALNKIYDAWRVQQRDAQMPIVTVMRATKGALVNYTVTACPFKVEFPPWPDEAPVNQFADIPAAKTSPRIQLPSNWMETAQPAPARPLTANRTAPVASAAPNGPAAPTPESLASPAAEPTATISISVTPAAREASKRAELTPPAPQAKGWLLAPGDDSPLPAPKPTRSTTTTYEEKPPGSRLPAVTTATASAPSNALPSVIAESTPFHAPPVLGPTSPGIAILKVASANATNLAQNESATRGTSVVAVAASAPSGSAPVRAESYLTVPRTVWSGSRILSLISVALLAGLGVLYLGTRRRSRPAARFSLITRSMDTGGN